MSEMYRGVVLLMSTDMRFSFELFISLNRLSHVQYLPFSTRRSISHVVHVVTISEMMCPLSEVTRHDSYGHVDHESSIL